MFPGNKNQDNSFNKVNDAFSEFLIEKEEKLVLQLCGDKNSHNNFSEWRRHKTRKSTIYTENGVFTHQFQILKHKMTKEIICPLKDFLGILPKQRISEDLKQKIFSKLSLGTYQRTSEDINNSFNILYTRQHIHYLFKRHESLTEIQFEQNGTDKILMCNGVKTCGHKFETKVLTSLDENNNPTLITKDINVNWEELLTNIDLLQYEVCIGDCEPGLKQALTAKGVRFHNCHVHAIRVFGYFLWKDKVQKEERKFVLNFLESILYTLQNSTKKFFMDKDVSRLQNRIFKTKEGLEKLSQQCLEKGYRYSAAYLENNKEYLVTAAELAIEKGLVVPWTTNQIERCMREIGYRTKKKGMNWSKSGLNRIVNLVLKRYFLPMQERYYKNYFTSNNISEVKV